VEDEGGDVPGVVGAVVVAALEGKADDLKGALHAVAATVDSPEDGLRVHVDLAERVPDTGGLALPLELEAVVVAPARLRPAGGLVLGRQPFPPRPNTGMVGKALRAK
jgi:hypothetical protein